jgi:hypothetical protein
LGGGHGNCRVGLVAHGRHIAAQLTEEGVVIQCTRQRIRMIEPLGQAEGLGTPRAGQRRIPTQPQGPGIMEKARYARVKAATARGQYVVPFWIKEGVRMP